MNKGRSKDLWNLRCLNCGGQWEIPLGEEAKAFERPCPNGCPQEKMGTVFDRILIDGKPLGDYSGAEIRELAHVARRNKEKASFNIERLPKR